LSRRSLDGTGLCEVVAPKFKSADVEVVEDGDQFGRPFDKLRRGRRANFVTTPRKAANVITLWRAVA